MGSQPRVSVRFSFSHVSFHKMKYSPKSKGTTKSYILCWLAKNQVTDYTVWQRSAETEMINTKYYIIHFYFNYMRIKLVDRLNSFTEENKAIFEITLCLTQLAENEKN